MKRTGYLAYAGIFILLGVSILPFLYNRTIAAGRTAKQLITMHRFETSYQQNDRYQAVVNTHQLYPNLPLYFLSNSTKSDETSYLWQMVQSYYLSYPTQITELKVGRDDTIIKQLQQNKQPGIVITPFEQADFKQAIVLHPHAEYYLYIVR